MEGDEVEGFVEVIVEVKGGGLAEEEGLKVVDVVLCLVVLPGAEL